MKSLFHHWSTQLVCLLQCNLVEANPHANQPLPQLCHVLYWRLIDSFLHHSPSAVINRICLGCWVAK